MKTSSILFAASVCVIAVSVGYYALAYVPALTVRQVSLEGNSGKVVPNELTLMARDLYGKPLFGSTEKEMERRLNDVDVLSSWKIARKIPDTYVVAYTVREADALLLETSGGRVLSILGLSDGTLFPVPLEDEGLWDANVLRMCISSSYKTMLVEHGVDRSLLDTVAWLGGQKGNMSLITTVEYDNNRNDRLGRVVLRLASLHAEVCVREEVDGPLLGKAIDVVEKAERGALHLDGAWTRYDLYASALVRR